MSESRRAIAFDMKRRSEPEQDLADFARPLSGERCTCRTGEVIRGSARRGGCLQSGAGVWKRRRGAGNQRSVRRVAVVLVRAARVRLMARWRGVPCFSTSLMS
jgi:hypothetical protein